MIQAVGKPLKPHATFIELSRSLENRYHEDSVWECLTVSTGQHHRIGGALAQVLEKYPSDFELKLIAVPVLTERTVSP